MAWTTPRDWTGISNDIVTAAMLNVDLRDNLGVLSTHAHTGAAGQGASSMSGLTLAALATLTFADQSANPDAAGELQRHGNDLLFYGSSAVNLTAADAGAGTASLRSLGTTSAKAAAGNHTHTPTTPSTSALTGSNVTEASASRTYIRKDYSSGETLDGTSKSVTPTKTANLVIVVCFLATYGAGDLAKVTIKQTVGASETTLQVGVTQRIIETYGGSTYGAYGADYFEISDLSAAAYTFHLEANDDMSVSAAWLIATVVEV
jgi:hypothetical protein